MSLPESKCSADLFCRSAAFPCPSGTSEESQKAKVKTQKSKVRTGLCLRLLLSGSGNLHGKARKKRCSARLALQP